MFKWQRRLMAALLAAASFSSSAATGQQSHAFLDWFSLEGSFHLQDLNPADTIDPELTWIGRESFAHANPMDLTGGAVIQSSFDWDAELTAVSGRANAVAHPGILLASGEGLQPGEYSLARAGRTQSFVLSPNTEVTFFALTAASVDPSGFDPSGPPGAFYATAMLSAYWNATPSVIEDTAAFHAFHHQFGSQLGSGGALVVSLTNASSSAVEGSIFGFVEAEAIAPIPEPHTYVLMLLGIGVVGMRHRAKTRSRTVSGPREISGRS